MDENTYLLITLLIVELFTLITTITNTVMGFIQNKDEKMLRSSCCGSSIEYNVEDKRGSREIEIKENVEEKT